MQPDTENLSEITLGQLTQRTEELVQQVQLSGDLQPAYQALTDIIRDFENTGHSVDEVVIAVDDLGLGFNKRALRDGRGFWHAYSRVLRRSLCNTGGELHSKVKLAIAAGSSSTISILFPPLGIPVSATPLLAPIAAILLTLGIDAFCECTSDDEQ